MYVEGYIRELSIDSDAMNALVVGFDPAPPYKVVIGQCEYILALKNVDGIGKLENNVDSNEAKLYVAEKFKLTFDDYCGLLLTSIKIAHNRVGIVFSDGTAHKVTKIFVL